jgi:hypothetical protein
MRSLILLVTILLCPFIFAQKGKKVSDPLTIPKKSYDSLLLDHEEKMSRFEFITDSLMKELDKQVKPAKQIRNSVPVQLKATATVVGQQQWSISNLGGSAHFIASDSQDAIDFLNAKKFKECRDDNEWKSYLEQNVPAYFALPDTLSSLGFYFNVPGIIKLNEILESTDWRIANYKDFSNLYSNTQKVIASLKLTGYNAFQLIAGNPSIEIMQKKSKWNIKVVDIYGLNIYPYSYYSGSVKEFADEDYAEYFSDFDSNGYVIVTHISPDNRTAPFTYTYGEESLNYGFLIRLIKK